MSLLKHIWGCGPCIHLPATPQHQATLPVVPPAGPHQISAVVHPLLWVAGSVSLECTCRFAKRHPRRNSLQWAQASWPQSLPGLSCVLTPLQPKVLDLVRWWQFVSFCGGTWGHYQVPAVGNETFANIQVFLSLGANAQKCDHWVLCCIFKETAEPYSRVPVPVPMSLGK